MMETFRDISGRRRQASGVEEEEEKENTKRLKRSSTRTTKNPNSRPPIRQSTTDSSATTAPSSPNHGEAADQATSPHKDEKTCSSKAVALSFDPAGAFDSQAYTQPTDLDKAVFSLYVYGENLPPREICLYPTDGPKLNITRKLLQEKLGDVPTTSSVIQTVGRNCFSIALVHNEESRAEGRYELQNTGSTNAIWVNYQSSKTCLLKGAKRFINSGMLIIVVPSKHGSVQPLVTKESNSVKGGEAGKKKTAPRKPLLSFQFSVPEE
eukprot:GEMP01053912.1.p1 GENE.GEMP01053912.1~~GEMP01053912.1.p1  ORF type:complete len:300 (+),score=73.21 GEMP01053912.1:105-902(+)